MRASRVPFWVALVGLAASVIVVAPSPASAAAAPNGKITFTFNSPDNPWSPAEITQLKNDIAVSYPVIESVVGHPFFTITVDVEHATASQYAGEYISSRKEIVLADVDAEVLIHEIVHAFRDADTLNLSTWEEGMTRAAEVEVCDRLTICTSDFVHHADAYDVYDDNMTTPAIGSSLWSVFLEPALVLVRYELAGYAWGKVVIENPTFLRKFNARLFTAAGSDPAITGDEPGLVRLAELVQPTVEGAPFADWYVAQGVLNSGPPTGPILFERGQQSAVVLDSFVRNSSGTEAVQAGENVDYTWTDVTGQVVASGSGTTTTYGWVEADYPSLPGYSGLLRLTATAGAASVSLPWYYPPRPAGVFGVTPASATGTVSFSSPSNAFAPFDVAITNGGFVAPDLASVRGTIVATVRAPGQATWSRTFTKDASDYFLRLKRTPAVTDDLAATFLTVHLPTTVMRGSYVSLRVATTNERPSYTPPSVTRIVLSTDAALSKSDTVIAERRETSIAPGEKHAGTLTAVVPHKMPRGTYHLGVCADTTAIVAEVDETNNCQWVDGTVQVT